MHVPGIACLLACGVLAFALSPSPLRAADDATEINRLVQQGNSAEALKRIDAYLARNPGDVKMRFQKGLLLTERGSTAEAITTFSALTRDHPEVPEPYNNLAVLHASRGEYDKARAALETAIRLNPNYAIAYENLGDIHAKLASQAYEKSRDLDKSNAVSQAKIDIIKGVFASQAAPGPSAKKVETRKPEATKVAALPPAKSEVASSATAGSKGKASEDAAKPAAGPPASAATVSATPAATDGAAEVVATLKRWAEAWTKKDATGYLAFYAPEFKVPGGESRAKWEAGRRARIDKPRKIEVNVGEPKVSLSDKNRAEVSFQQHYRSDTLNERVNKTMVFTKKDGSWLILEEQSLK